MEGKCTLHFVLVPGQRDDTFWERTIVYDTAFPFRYVHLEQQVLLRAYELGHTFQFLKHNKLLDKKKSAVF